MTSDDKSTTLPTVKVSFQPNDGYYTTTESLWADDLGDGRYRLRNSPWYIYGVSFEDIVHARLSAEGVLEFIEVVEHSGSSTFRIMLREDTDPADFHRDWQPLGALGCTWEQAKDRLYAVDAPPDTDLDQVAELLRAGEAHGVWDWEAGYWHEAGTAQGEVSEG